MGRCFYVQYAILWTLNIHHLRLLRLKFAIKMYHECIMAVSRIWELYSLVECTAAMQKDVKSLFFDFFAFIWRLFLIKLRKSSKVTLSVFHRGLLFAGRFVAWRPLQSSQQENGRNVEEIKKWKRRNGNEEMNCWKNEEQNKVDTGHACHTGGFGAQNQELCTSTHGPFKRSGVTPGVVLVTWSDPYGAKMWQVERCKTRMIQMQI